MRVILFLMLFVLSACSDLYYVSEKGNTTMKEQGRVLGESTTFSDTYETLKLGLKRDSAPTRRSLAEFAYPEMESSEGIHPKAKPSQNIAAVSKNVYCYKTLADVNCYNEPMHGQEFRRVGN